MMKSKEIQITVYPTPAPKSGQTLFETDTLQEINRVCEKLFRSKWPLKDYPRTKIYNYFRELLKVMSLTQHMEIVTSKGGIDWENLLVELRSKFPQFAWVYGQIEKVGYDQKVFRLDFIPLYLQNEGFPFEINLANSVGQQLSQPSEVAIDALKEMVHRLVHEKGLIIIEKTKIQLPKKQPIVEPQQKAHPERTEEKNEMATTETEINTQLLMAQEEIKREKYTKERLRIANSKLEIMLEKLELSMLYSGIKHFEQKIEQDEHWHQRIKVDLREYTYLLQKAKYLEQMWHINENLVNKSEKMTVTENTLIYERDQVNQIKEKISSSDIYFVIYECQVIESRAKIYARPLFRKPYVKMMKMDYENLQSKAAYFDLLQGESYILERIDHSRQAKTAPVEEVG